MSTTGGRKEPAGWLMRIRTLGPGAMLRQRKPGRAGKGPARRDEGPEKMAAGAVMDEVVRKKVADSLNALLDRYPFGLLAARIGAQDVDLILRCPSTDLALIADLVKKRLLDTIHEAGLGTRFWRKGFLRRALGSDGELRRALVLFRQDARRHQSLLIDRVRHDEKLGVRTRRPKRPIE